MFKPASAAATITLIWASMVLAADESITITTYYPSPTGVYKQLKLAPQSSPPSACDSNARGTMYYNSTDNLVYACNGTAFNSMSGAAPSGMIAMFTTCPSGWTRFAALDGRVPRGSATYGGTGGADTHRHTITASGSGGPGGAILGAPAQTELNSSWPPYLDVIWCQKN